MAATERIVPVLRGGPQREAPGGLEGIGKGKQGQEPFLVSHGGGGGDLRGRRVNRGGVDSVESCQQALGRRGCMSGTWPWATGAAVSVGERGQLGCGLCIHIPLPWFAVAGVLTSSRNCLLRDGQSLQSQKGPKMSNHRSKEKRHGEHIF